MGSATGVSEGFHSISEFLKLPEAVIRAKQQVIEATREMQKSFSSSFSPLLL